MNNISDDKLIIDFFKNLTVPLEVARQLTYLGVIQEFNIRVLHPIGWHADLREVTETPRDGGEPKRYGYLLFDKPTNDTDSRVYLPGYVNDLQRKRYIQEFVKRKKIHPDDFDKQSLKTMAELVFTKDKKQLDAVIKEFKRPDEQ